MSLPNGEAYCLHMIMKNKDVLQFNSRDRKKSGGRKDPAVGLRRLLKLAQKHESGAQNIDIYDHQPGNPADGKLVFRWNRGKISVNLIS